MGIKTLRRGKKKPAPAYYFSNTASPSYKSTVRSVVRCLLRQFEVMGLATRIKRAKMGKSQTQYIEVDARKRLYIVRVSDHALRQGGYFDYDIYTCNKRDKAFNHVEFIKFFRPLTGEQCGGV